MAKGVQGRLGHWRVNFCYSDYTLTAKDRERKSFRESLRESEVWEPRVWEPTILEPTIWEPTVSWLPDLDLATHSLDWKPTGAYNLGAYSPLPTRFGFRHALIGLEA